MTYEDAISVSSNSVLQNLIWQELLLTMKYSFQKLDSKYQMILSLKIFYLYTFQEIRELMGFSSSYIFRSYQKGCERLKEIFVELYYHFPSIFSLRSG